jgi:hypothetical protein
MATPDEERSVFGTIGLIREYIETKITLLRLQSVRGAAKLTGYFVWLMIVLVLSSLLLVFLGIVSGFWFSSLTGSYVTGFALTAGILLLLLILLATVGRNLFVNPVIRAIIRRLSENDKINDIE